MRNLFKDIETSQQNASTKKQHADRLLRVLHVHAKHTTEKYPMLSQLLLDQHGFEHSMLVGRHSRQYLFSVLWLGEFITSMCRKLLYLRMCIVLCKMDPRTQWRIKVTVIRVKFPVHDLRLLEAETH